MAAVLVLIASLRIISTYKIFNFVIDEPAHAACGAQWLDGRTYRYEAQHPPLARVVAAVGLHCAGMRWRPDPNMWYEGIRLLGGGGRNERGLVFARAAMLPLFWIACAVVYLWACRGGGVAAGAISVLLFSSLPPILGHAGLATTDMALTAFAGAAFLSSLYWIEKPNTRRAMVLGILTGLAVLSKFSAIPFLACAWALVVVVYAARQPAAALEAIRKAARTLPAAMAVAGIVIWAGYRFSFGAADGIPFRVPAPELIAGIQALLKHNAAGQPAYLLGMVKMGGFWYYYPVALAFKTPLAFSILCIVSLVAAAARHYAVRTPVLFSAGVLLFAMFFSRINIGTRHVLPVYMGVAVAAGIACSSMLRGRRSRRAVAAVSLLLATGVLSGVLQHPDYLAYTNELCWNHPERVLADSDVDWGQDMKRLSARMQQLGVTSIYFDPFNRGYLLTDQHFPKTLPVPEGAQPRAGWTAVSITEWKLAHGPGWLNTTAPTEKIGRSILLFHR